MLLLGSPNAVGHQAQVSTARPGPILAVARCLEPSSVDGIQAASNVFNLNCLVASGQLSAPTPKPILAVAQCREPSSVDGIQAASNLFNANCLVASAHEPFTIDFDNKDLGVVHNVAVYSHDPALRRPATVLLRGEGITGPGTAVYVVPSLRPGVFYFRCDTHPTLMSGSFRVQ